jgi:G:T-mismatch repair DNA endonuclease (very short patch repair protein)
MADVFSKEKGSKIMSKIESKDTATKKPTPKRGGLLLPLSLSVQS